MIKIAHYILALFLSIILTSCFNMQGENKLIGNSKNDDNKEKMFSLFLIKENGIEDLQNNLVTREIEEVLDVSLSIKEIHSEDVNKRKAMMFYSNNYPDIFLSGQFSSEELVKYGEIEKKLIPLNDLIINKTMHLKSLYMNPKNIKHILTPNGLIYGIPSIDEDPSLHHQQVLWMNTKWLEDLKLDIPHTTDEFYSVLSAFKKDDPNGNDLADEIPLTGANNSNFNSPIHFIMNAFIYDDGWSYFSLKDNHLSFPPSEPQWREGLKYMNKLFSENLIDINSFYQSADHLKLNIKNDHSLRYGAIADSDLKNSMYIEDSLVRHTFYTSIPPLKGPEGIQSSPYYESIKYYYDFAITNKCANAEKAIEIADYLVSPEGTFLTVYGKENISWEYIKNNSPAQYDIYERKAVWKNLEEDNVIKNSLWGRSHLLHLQKEDLMQWAINEDVNSRDRYFKRKLSEITENYAPYKSDIHFHDTFVKASMINEVIDLNDDIIEYVEKSMINFITGNMDIEEDWELYLKRLDQLGLDRYLSIYQQAFTSE